MRKLLLLPLLFGFTSAVNAESVWLLVDYIWDYSESHAAAFEKIEMKDMEQCEEQAAVYKSADTLYSIKRKRGYVCLKGK